MSSDSESSIQIISDNKEEITKLEEILDKSLTECNNINSANVSLVDNINKSLKTSESAKKRIRTESTKREKELKEREESRIKREEEKRKRDEEKERIRLEKLEEAKKREEEKKKREEEKEKQRLEKLEELKRKEEERERQRLEKLEEAKKRDEEKKKRDEEKEKQKQEKIEREKKRLEQLNARNEEKKRKEEEKLREEDEKKRKADKVKQQFCNYFIKKTESTTQQNQEDEKSYRFMAFQVKENMYLAPSCRRLDYQDDKSQIIDNLDKFFEKQDCANTYLTELRKSNKSRQFPDTLVLHKFNEECIEVEEDQTVHKFKIKYLHFDPKQYRRPPYYGTWRKKSEVINAKKPFAKDTKLIDYEINSDEEWEDEGEGESIEKSDEEDEVIANEDEEDDDDGFFVPHGHLSDDEIDEENRILEPELKEKIELVKLQQWENESKKKSKHIVTKFVGCIWDSSHQDYKQLQRLKMVPLNNITLPIPIEKPILEQPKPSTKDEPATKTSKTKQNINNDQNSSPASKIKSKSKQNTDTKQQMQSTNTTTPNVKTPTTPNTKVPTTPNQSILKFISKLSNKKEIKSIVITPLINTNDTLSSSSPSTHAGEKRVCSDNDENNVKRLKLDENDGDGDIEDNDAMDTDSIKINNKINAQTDSKNKENEVIVVE